MSLPASPGRSHPPPTSQQKQSPQAGASSSGGRDCRSLSSPHPANAGCPRPLPSWLLALPTGPRAVPPSKPAPHSPDRLPTQERALPTASQGPDLPHHKRPACPCPAQTHNQQPPDLPSGERRAVPSIPGSATRPPTAFCFGPAHPPVWFPRSSRSAVPTRTLDGIPRPRRPHRDLTSPQRGHLPYGLQACPQLSVSPPGTADAPLSDHRAPTGLPAGRSAPRSPPV